MSAYNGEKYIEEQIFSIFNQKYDKSAWDLKLYVRDDGSTDNTRSIVHKLAKKYNIEMDFNGPNIGFAKSFYKLLASADADYYFFSDQDDIWLPNKLSLFIGRMLKLECQNVQNIGVFSDAWIADEIGNSTGKKLLQTRLPRIHNSSLSFINQLFEFYVQGASMAINKNIVEKLLFLPFLEIPFKESHDHFIGLVVSYIGQMSYIDEPTLLYRQSGDNVYGARSTLHKAIIKRIKSISSRIKTVQGLLLTAELVSGILVSYGDQNIYNELKKLNAKKNIYFASKYFLKYRKYVSISNPIIVSVLYGIYFKPNTLLHEKIQTLIEGSNIHEDYLDTATKL